MDSGLSRSAGAVFSPPAWAPWLFYPFFFFGGRVVWIALLVAIAAACALPHTRQRMRPAYPLLFLWLLYVLVHLAVAAGNHDAPRMRMPIDAVTVVLASGALLALSRRAPGARHDHAAHQDLSGVYDQVPADYWDATVMQNPVQRFYYEARFRAVRDVIRDVPNGARLLDVGCGSGFTIAHVVRPLPAIRVTGVDVSEKLIEQARKVRPEHEWQVSTGERLSGADGSFDVVTYLDVSEHLVDPIAAYQEAYRVLRPGGRIVVQLVFEDHPLFQLIWQIWLKTRGKVWEHAHLRVYTPKSLRDEIVAAGFVVAQQKQYHLGMWGVCMAFKPEKKV